MDKNALNELLRNSLIKIEALESTLEKSSYIPSEPIAIIGMACRFPGGANNIEKFWELLDKGLDTSIEIPRDRWNIDEYYSPDLKAPGKMVSRFCSFLDQPLDMFDADFFSINPREAETLDPQQRLLLEVSWEALEHAGINPQNLRGSPTGIFAGISSHDYADLLDRNADPEEIDAYFGSGNAASTATGRISYTLGLQGPSIAVDTACSSSLVALHLACQSIHAQESELALVGGVNVLLSPYLNINFSQAHMLANDGLCKTFDAKANGYVRGEGCGVIVLKRLSAAQQDGDRILAVIRGSSVNQDGASSGLTAPNRIAQAAVINSALSQARLSATDIDYIEAHGTGTQLGDPIEIGALGEVFGADQDRTQPLVIGTVKTNIGHLEASAGIAGVIKTVLALQHQRIPAHLHFKQLNPRINLQAIPAELPLTARDWIGDSVRPRRAGVSSFGFGGTNAHVILEEPLENITSTDAVAAETLHLLMLSAKNAQALDELRLRYIDYLADPKLAITDVCYTSQTGRARLGLTVGVVGRTLQELCEGLANQRYVDETEMTSYQYDASIRFRKVALPHYAFQRQHYWAQGLVNKKTSLGTNLHPLLGVCLPGIATETGIVFTQKIDWEDVGLQYLPDHVIFNRCVFPASAYIEMLVNALRHTQNSSDEGEAILSLRDISIKLPLVWETHVPLTLQTIVRLEVTGYQLQIYSQAAKKWRLHVQAKGDLNNPLPIPSELDLVAIQARCSHVVDVAQFYQQLAIQGLQYGPTFQGIQQLWKNDHEALAKIGVQESELKTPYTFYPPLLDSVFQTLAALAENLVTDKTEAAVYVPTSVEHLLCYESLPNSCYAHVTMEESWLTNKDALHSGTLVAQISLFTEKGSLIATFKNFTVRRITATLLNTLLTPANELSDCYYEQVWKEYELPLIQIDQEASSTPTNTDIIFDAGTDMENTPSLISAQNLLAFFQNLFQNTDTKQRVTIITKQAYSISGEPICLSQAALNGLIKTAILEHPERQIRQVDILASQEPLSLLEILNKTDAQEQIFAYRDQWYVARLRKEVEVNAQRQLLTLPLGDYHLIKNDQGLIESLALKEIAQVLSPDVDEVILTPHAVGLNFRDVLNAMNLYPGDPGPLGGDCAGVITAVGSQVLDLQVGDEVFGIAYGSLASTALSKGALLVKKPPEITMEEAATLPTVFLTAYYTLIEVANLQAGETVLIHAGSGGVGLASIQLARWRGARIIVSAGSEEKRNYLKALGVDAIVDSRHVSFAEEIAKLTEGRGVDVVLNMLSGEGFVAASVKSCALGGRFLEIGKRGIWSMEEMSQARPDIQYSIVALDEMMQNKANYIHELLEKVLDLLKQGICQPLPRRTFPVTHSIDAFKYLQQARQIGKVVISLPPAAITFDSAGIYWVTGGLGGLGLVVGRYLIDHGVKHLVLTSRHAENSAAHDEIEAWRAQGCEVEVILVDVGDKTQLRSVFAQVCRSGQPLRGIFHLAGAIEDASLTGQTTQSFERVFAGKAQGAWNLHELSQEYGITLDYFVLFSSIASLLGSPGQGNYATANSFLDGLAVYRQQQGLAGISINWGPWAEVGMAKNLVDTHQRQGLSALSPIQGMSLWEYVLKQSPAQCAVIKIDWERMREALTQPPSWLQELVEKRQLSSFVQDLRQVPVDQQVNVLKAVIRQELAKVLGISNKEEIDDKKNFMDLGMDSLRSAELINRLQAKIGNAYTLSFSEVAEHQNIEDLTQYLASLLLTAESLSSPANTSTLTVDPNNYAKYIRFDTYPNYQQLLALSQNKDSKI
ncbi:MAG: SDR family NAD(P)-dependent oxidoreductase, partial [Gammaproteobacteria bacterium]